MSDVEDAVPVIILNWNGEDDTVACLESIRDSDYAGFVPVVVDNGSDPVSLPAFEDACRSIFDRVLVLDRRELSASGAPGAASFSEFLTEDSMVLIRNGENLGFAKGSNVGIRFAELAGADCVMLLNNDTVVESGTFREMRRFMTDNPSFYAATAQIRYLSQPAKVQNCGGDLTYFGSRKYRFADADADAVPDSAFSVVTFATGCALLLRYKAVGVLTEKFFFGEEDYELALRMKERGLPMACVHGSVVLHRVGASIRRSAKPIGAILVHYVSRLIDVRRYYSKPRWQATRMIAYAYLPFLLWRSGIDPRQAGSLIRRIESYVREGSGVSHSDFQTMIASR